MISCHGSAMSPGRGGARHGGSGERTSVTSLLDLGLLAVARRKAPGTSIRNRAARTPCLYGRGPQATDATVEVPGDARADPRRIVGPEEKRREVEIEMIRIGIPALVLLVSSLAFAGDVTPSASKVIHINGRAATFTELTLDEGCYTVQPVAGTFKAWSPWRNAPAGCQTGDTCTNGFTTDFQVKADGFTDRADKIRVFTKPTTWRTQDLALANPTTGTFCLSTTQKVGFRVNDTQFGDNQAGVSLKVSSACSAGL